MTGRRLPEEIFILLSPVEKLRTIELLVAHINILKYPWRRSCDFSVLKRISVIWCLRIYSEAGKSIRRPQLRPQTHAKVPPALFDGTMSAPVRKITTLRTLVTFFITKFCTGNCFIRMLVSRWRFRHNCIWTSEKQKYIKVEYFVKMKLSDFGSKSSSRLYTEKAIDCISRFLHCFRHKFSSTKPRSLTVVKNKESWGQFCAKSDPTDPPGGWLPTLG